MKSYKRKRLKLHKKKCTKDACTKDKQKGNLRLNF